MPAVNIYLPEADYVRLVEISKKESCKVSELLQVAVKEFLTKETA